MEVDPAIEFGFWMFLERLDPPLVILIDEDLEQHIFGDEDEYLRITEVHSNTLIQLERWFTPSGLTRVIVTGPFRAKLWIIHMILYLSIPEASRRAQGQEMLDRVRSQPLTTADLNALPYCQQISRTLGYCSQSSGGTTLN